MKNLLFVMLTIMKLLLSLLEELFLILISFYSNKEKSSPLNILSYFGFIIGMIFLLIKLISFFTENKISMLMEWIKLINLQYDKERKKNDEFIDEVNKLKDNIFGKKKNSKRDNEKKINK